SARHRSGGNLPGIEKGTATESDGAGDSRSGLELVCSLALLWIPGAVRAIERLCLSISIAPHHSGPAAGGPHLCSRPEGLSTRSRRATLDHGRAAPCLPGWPMERQGISALLLDDPALETSSRLSVAAACRNR